MGKRLRFACLIGLTAPLILTSAAFGQGQAPPAEQAPAGDESEGDEGEEVPVEEETPVEEEGDASERAAEEELSDEDAELLAELEGEDPQRPPPAGKGVIWGVVKETEFKETLVEAPVTVIGRKEEVITDLEGRFRLELPPGTYSLRVSYELHKSARIDGVVVAAGRLVRLDFDLVPDKDAIDVFEVIEEADKTSLEGLILARQRSTVVGDSVGRAEIAKTTDKDAAQAAQRVVGATIVGGRFVYVRGLGERYTNALLNGVPLPSPEPDRAAVPLDLFPTGVLNSLTIAKTFTPDSPGDFAGGSVRIETREIPREPLFQLSAGLGYNTDSTFRSRLTQRGGSLDWLGIDDGTRALPDEVPDEFISPTYPVEQRTAAGRALNSYMTPERAGTPPNFSFGLVAGNGWDFGNDRKLGVITALNYGRSFSVRRGEIIRILTPPGPDEDEFHLARDYRATTGTDRVNWGAFGSISYRFNAQHQLNLTGIRTTLADIRSQYITGYHDLRSANLHVTRLGFTTRALNSGMLRGEHRFPDLGRAELDWNVVMSVATRDEPDRRDAVWGDTTLNNNGTYIYTDASESGRHFFSDQSETQRGGGLDWTQPFEPLDSKLKLGGLVSLRDRDFNARALSLSYRDTDNAAGTTRPTFASHPVIACPSRNLDQCNDALFRPENIGHAQEHALELAEFRGDGDSYDAGLNIYAAYLMADMGVTKDVRVVFGERIEHTHQFIEAYDANGIKDPDLAAKIKQTDLLPAVSAAWSVTDRTKLRVSGTRTLARPQLRELAPFTFQDYFGGRVEGGNPDLQLTNITNVDFRIENFPTLREVLAFSLFFKDFRNPIESVILGGGDEGSISYRNAKGARLIGIEFEARKDLAFIHDAVKDISVSTNLTFAHSAIDVEREATVALTNLTRPMVNQAPWVYNVAVGYSNEDIGISSTLLFNVVGPRIVLAGSQGLDDVYEHPRPLLDLTVQQKLMKKISLKLEGKNLINSPVLQTQGCGGKGAFGSTWYLRCTRGHNAAVRRWTEGVSFGLSGAYDF